jgi:hypothetical protein
MAVVVRVTVLLVIWNGYLKEQEKYILLKGIDEISNYRLTCDVNTGKFSTHLCQPMSKIGVKSGTDASGLSSLTEVINDSMWYETICFML